MSAAAFFDIDGTLLAAPSLERRLLRFLRWRGEIGIRQVARGAAGFVSRVWRHPLAATHGNKLYLRGVSESSLRAGLAFLRRFPLPLFPAAVERVAWHAAAGHRIVLVSGTLQPLAEVVAEALRRLPYQRLGTAVRVDAIATQLEIRDGLFTGRVTGTAVCGPEKARVLERVVAAGGIALDQSFAYGDGWLDRWMLERVAHPAAVNPSFLLAKYARLRGWPVLHWASGAPRDRFDVIPNPEPSRGARDLPPYTRPWRSPSWRWLGLRAARRIGCFCSCATGIRWRSSFFSSKSCTTWCA